MSSDTGITYMLPPGLDIGPDIETKLEDLTRRMAAGEISPDRLDQLAARFGELSRRVKESQRAAGGDPAQTFLDNLKYRVQTAQILADFMDEPQENAT